MHNFKKYIAFVEYTYERKIIKDTRYFYTARLIPTGKSYKIKITKKSFKKTKAKLSIYEYGFLNNDFNVCIIAGDITVNVHHFFGRTEIAMKLKDATIDLVEGTSMLIITDDIKSDKFKIRKLSYGEFYITNIKNDYKNKLINNMNEVSLILIELFKRLYKNS